MCVPFRMWGFSQPAVDECAPGVRKRTRKAVRERPRLVPMPGRFRARPNRQGPAGGQRSPEGHAMRTRTCAERFESVAFRTLGSLVLLLGAASILVKLVEWMA